MPEADALVLGFLLGALGPRGVSGASVKKQRPTDASGARRERDQGHEASGGPQRPQPGSEGTQAVS